MGNGVVPIVADVVGSRILFGAKRANNSYALYEVSLINGYVYNELSLPAKPTAIVNNGVGGFFVSYVKNNNAVVALYNVNTKILTEWYVVEGELAVDLLLAGNAIYFSTNKALYSFDAEQYSIVQKMMDIKCNAMVYDDLSKSIYFADDYTVYQTLASSFVPVFYNSSSHPIFDLELIYNK